MLSGTAWAEDPIVTTDSRPVYESTSTTAPEFVYKIHGGRQNETKYWGSAGAQVEGETNAYQFAFYKKAGVENQYYIYSTTEKKYLSYDQSAIANGENLAKNADTQEAANPWYISKITVSNVEYFQLQPVTSKGTPASFYANWYKNTAVTHTAMGFYETNGTGDPGSAWTFVLTEDKEKFTLTYNITIDGSTSSLCTLQFNDVPKDATYPTPVIPSSYNFNCSSDYYSWDGFPSGLVSKTETLEITLKQNMPFTISSSYDDATWYALSISSKKNKLYFEEVATQMPLSRTTTDYEAKDLFCFVGDIVHGFEIYNMAAGDDMLLSSGSNPYDGSTGGVTYVTMADKSTAEKQAHLWDVTKSSYIDNGFFLGMHGLAAGRMNNRGSLAFWVQNADDGSTFTVEAVSDDALSTVLANAKTLYSSNILSNTIADNLNTATTNYEAGKTRATSNALLIAFNAYKTAIMPRPGKFYSFQCASTEGYYVLSTLSDSYKDSGKTRLSTAAASETNVADRIFYFDGNSMMGYNNGYFLVKNSDGSGFLTQGTVGVNSGTKFTFSIADYSKGTQCVNFENGTRGMYAKDNGFVNAGSANTTSDGYTFNVKEITELPLTIGANGWSSFSAPVDVCVPTESGVKVYYAPTAPADGKLVLTELTGGIIPASTGVLVSGTEGTIVNFSTETDNASANNVDNNNLVSNWYVNTVGNSTETTAKTDGLYAFATKTSDDNTKTTGFMKLLTQITLPGHKCYLYIPTKTEGDGETGESDGAGSAQFIPISLTDDPTGIESAETTTASDINAPIYDLQGRKVNGTQKGGMYIQNGKVFIAM